MAVFQNNLLAGAGAQSGTTTHTIDQSIRFNDDDSAYMSRTPSSASNRKTFTISLWVKRGNLTANMNMFGPQTNNTGSGTYGTLRFEAGGDRLDFMDYSNGTYNWYYSTSPRAFRDPSAWYHIVASLDTTNAIASERIKVYINGQRDGGWSGNNGYYPTLNYEGQWNNTLSHEIGAIQRGSTNQYFDGYLADIVFIDGQALTCDSFGEFNSSGIWIPKDVSGLTFGTNGFHIDGRDSADLGDDESGNGNDFTTSGLASHDQVADSPTNNFAVINSLVRSNNTLSEGNLKVTNSSSTPAKFVSTIGVTSGKWFMEYRYSGNPNYPVGITADNQERDYLGGTDDSTSVSFWTVSSQTSLFVNNVSLTWSGSGTTWSSGDIIGLALNADDSIIAIYKNGSSLGSYDYSALNWTTTFFAGGNYISGNIYNANFGQDGTFAGAITAGGNSDGNGIGNFKYSVPSGYLALCTKNLGS